MLCCNICSRDIKNAKEKSISDNEISYMTFSPPQNSNIITLTCFLLGLYSLVNINDECYLNKKAKTKHCAVLFQKCNFVHSMYKSDLYKWIQVEAYKIQKTNGKYIALIYITNIAYVYNQLI